MEWKVYQRIAEQNGEPTVVSVDWQRVWRFSSKLTSHVILVELILCLKYQTKLTSSYKVKGCYRVRAICFGGHMLLGHRVHSSDL